MPETPDLKAATVTAYCRQRGYPEPEAEWRFHPARMFRFDLAWPAHLLALEFDGGVYGRGKPCPLCGRKGVGAHSSVRQQKADREKGNLAVVAGWRVLRVLPEEVESGEVYSWLDAAFGEAINAGGGGG